MCDIDTLGIVEPNTSDSPGWGFLNHAWAIIVRKVPVGVVDPSRGTAISHRCGGVGRHGSKDIWL